MGTGIAIEGLVKRWGDTPVLDGADLQVQAGEFVALVGRSGAGKSTLLHLIAGIDLPDAGCIRLDHVDVGALDEDARTRLRRERLGLVFQAYNLVPSLCARDNVRLPMELAGQQPRASRPAADALLQRLGLGALAARFPEQLSGGEQQRVAVARALAHGPGLVLADEPTGSLDIANAAVVLDLLIDACRQRGTTLLMASHSQEVMGRADRLVRLDRGRIVAG
jgi:putative ABC transport system ATP-binding protein